MPTAITRCLYPAVCGFALLVMAPSPAMSLDSIGRTRVVVQTVTGEIEDLHRRHAVRDDVYGDELIETAAGSASIIRFVDRTRLTLGPNARITLDEIIFDPNPGRGKLVLSKGRQ